MFVVHGTNRGCHLFLLETKNLTLNSVLTSLIAVFSLSPSVWFAGSIDRERISIRLFFFDETESEEYRKKI